LVSDDCLVQAVLPDIGGKLLELVIIEKRENLGQRVKFHLAHFIYPRCCNQTRIASRASPAAVFPSSSAAPNPKDINMGALKIKDFPGLQRIAPETIEKHEMEQQLRDAQFALDVQLHDLRSEFLHRESKLRQDYLDRVAEITTA
jgi:hypothetical protein